MKQILQRRGVVSAREIREAGVTRFDGMRVNVYSAAKTVADLFKFRTRVGLDVALGALKEGLRRRLFSVDELMCAADVDRVKAVVSPYVEAYFA